MNPYIVQTLMGAIGSVGFAILFNVRGTRLILFFLGGALAWGVYLLCTRNGGSMFLGLLLASMSAAFISEVLARIVHSPVLILLVPMLIPLIPGRDLYYCMDALVRSDKETFFTHGTAAVTAAGAIGLGIICTTALSHIVFSIVGHIHRSKKQ
jgi:uncharacterized membrane protein YjjB (DUF3815 family)